MFVIADVAAGPFLLVSVVAGGLVLLAISLLEALVLWLISWGSFRQALRDSLIINLGSGLVGLLLSVFGSGLWQTCGYDPARGGRWCEQLVSPGVILIGFWALTVLIEGGLLTLLTKQPPRKIWTAALAINIVSYLLLGALTLLTGEPLI